MMSIGYQAAVRNGKLDETALTQLCQLTEHPRSMMANVVHELHAGNRPSWGHENTAAGMHIGLKMRFSVLCVTIVNTKS